MLSDDKISHLSHVILTCVKKTPAGHFKGDDVQALREIKRVLAAELAEEVGHRSRCSRAIRLVCTTSD